MYELVHNRRFADLANEWASQFSAHAIEFNYAFGPRAHNPRSLAIDLQNKYATVQVVSWDTGDLEVTAITHDHPEEPETFCYEAADENKFQAILTKCFIVMRDARTLQELGE